MRIQFILIAFVLSVVGTIVQLPVGSLAANCTSASGAYHAGYIGYVSPPQSWNETPEGVGSTLRVRNGNVCTGNFSVTTAWVMMADQNNPANHYAQAGYIRVGNDCLRRFFQYNSTGSPSGTTVGGCLTTGSDLFFAVVYTGPAGPYPVGCPSPYGWRMTADGYGVMAITPFDPWCLGWSFQPQYTGETTYTDNDIPGLPPPNEANFFSLYIQSVDNGAFRATPCYLKKVEEYFRYHANANSCTNVWVYTQ